MSDCLFCKISDGRISIKTIYSDEVCIAFPDVNPQAPTHLLLIPREHFSNVGGPDDKLLGHLLKAAASLGERELPDGYRVVINTGSDGGQTVSHLHLHLLGGRAMSWPPG